MVSAMERGAGSVEVSARPALPSTWSTSGKREDAVLRLKQALGLRDGNAGHGGGHVEQHAFIERRHELRAQPAKDRDGDGHQRDGGGDDRPFPAQRPCRHGVVKPDRIRLMG